MLYYVLFALFAVVISAILSMTVFFKVETITVVGNTAYADSVLIESTNIRMGESLLRFSAEKAARTLEEKFPYISDARVIRNFPANVTIEIETAQPFVSIETDDAIILLDKRGRVLEKSMTLTTDEVFRVIGFTGEKTVEVTASDSNTKTQRQPLVEGDYLDDTEGKKLTLLDEILQELSKNNLTVDVIDLSNTLSLRLLYEGRIVVELGGQTDLGYKIKFAAKAIFDSIEPHFVGVLDVSTRPTAKIRPMNIYDKEVWPFPEYMLADYLQSAAPEVEVVETPIVTPEEDSGEQEITAVTG